MVVLPREALYQEDVSTADLDDQRHAERSAAAAAAQVRAVETRAAEAAAAAATAPVPVAPAPAVAPASGDGELPALPRRRPAHAGRLAGAEGVGADVGATSLADGAVAEPTAVEPVAAAEPAAAEPASAEPAFTESPFVESPPAEPTSVESPAIEPAGAESPGAEPVGTDHPLDQPTQQLTIRHLDPQGEQLTELGLPRRVPRSTGLPGTGEAPASGLRRVAGAPAPAHARPDATGGGASPADPQAAPARPRTSAEELRRRLGGFQSGLRQAARESAPEGSEGQNR
jgi:hypothetical protein